MTVRAVSRERHETIHIRPSMSSGLGVSRALRAAQAGGPDHAVGLLVVLLWQNVYL